MHDAAGALLMVPVCHISVRAKRIGDTPRSYCTGFSGAILWTIRWSGLSDG